VRPSKANDLLAAALGATSDPRNGPELAAAVSAGEVRGSWGYFDAPTQPVEGEVFTGNEPAFARANVIIVNKKVYDGLSDRQKDELRAAAAQTRDWMAGRHTDPAATAAAYCSQANGTIAISSADDLAAMHAATAPVIAQLQSDPLSAQVIARIRELAKSVTPPATPLACAPGSVTRLPMPVLAPKGDQGALDGVWRLTIKGSTLIAAGATQVDAANNEGVWTWTFAGGKLQTVEPGGTSCDATYTLDGTRFLSVVPLPIGCEHVWSFTMVRSGDKLTVSQPVNVLSGSPIEGDATHYEPDPQSVTFYNAFFHEPMVRVGDAP